MLHGKYGPKMNNKFWKNKKILITGHTGFKGSWLSLWMKMVGANVCGIGLKPNDDSLFNQLNLSKKIDLHNVLNINEFSNLKKVVQKFNPDIVFHLAAQPLVRESYREPIKTWETNVLGSIKLLESLKKINKKCAIVIITTDKVYKNKEWDYGYRENDELGGHDPYSASKAALEIAINSWRKSFCGNEVYQNPFLGIASARAGNVIGGGDWAEERIIPDTIRALQSGNPVLIRNPNSTRPWQHVLEPISGYLDLAELIFSKENNYLYCDSFNFGPMTDSNKTVKDLLEESFKYWKGEWFINQSCEIFHESKMLNLQIEKAYNILGWKPKWDFNKTVEKTINWYKNTHNNIKSPEQACIDDMNEFMLVK